MSLSEAVANYLVSSDIHENNSLNHNYFHLKKLLKHVTMSQLNFEYNALSQQHLWTEPLTDLFYNELLRRLLRETTFSISTAWTDIASWVADPYARIFMGFEETYPVLTKGGSPILLSNDNIHSYTLSNVAFTDEDEKALLRLILTNSVNVYLSVTDSIQIVGVENSTDADERIFFVDGVDLEKTYRIPAISYELADFQQVKQMFLGVKLGTYPVIDPYSE